MALEFGIGQREVGGGGGDRGFGRAQREARVFFWLGFLVLGAVVGAAFYAYVPFVRESFDYWLALALP